MPNFDTALVNVPLLTSAARTVQTSSPLQTLPWNACATFYLDITAASGTGGLKLRIDVTDPLSGASATYCPALPSAAIVAIGLYVFQVGPFSETNMSLTGNWGTIMPLQWKATVTVGDASSYTYSLSADLFQ